MEIKALSSIPYGQAKVIIADNGDITLRSYATDVAEIRDGWLIIKGLYSMTTRKHISAFMREYTDYNYTIAKMLFEDRCKYNLNTGELVEICEY